MNSGSGQRLLEGNMADNNEQHSRTESETVEPPVSYANKSSREQEQGSTESKLPNDKNYWYRCRSFKPRCLQALNSMKFYVFLKTLISFLDGIAVVGLVPICIPAIEKQFGLPSSQSAFIGSAANFGTLAVVLFVSFAGDKLNKPNCVASGCLLTAIGSVIFIIPHIVSDAPRTALQNDSSADLCLPKANITTEAKPEDSVLVDRPSHLFVVFILARVIHGFGGAPLFTVGTAYIDDNVEHAVSAMYIGITLTASSVGMAAANVVGGQIIELLYVDFDRIDQSSLGFGPRDSNWIGAWWLGFIVSAIGFSLVAIPIYGFPSSLPESLTLKKETPTDSETLGKQTSTDSEALGKETSIESETLEKETSTESETLKKETATDLETVEMKNNRKSKKQVFKEEAMSFFKALLKLVLNGEFVFLCLGGAVEMFIIGGVMVFSFKYLLEQYNLPFDKAGYLLGGMTVLGAIGIFLGGMLIRCFRLNSIGIERMTAFMIFLAAICGVGFLAGCPNVRLSGVEIPYPGQSSLEPFNFSAACLDNCHCDDNNFDLVCGKDNRVYLSPCYAGCSTTKDASDDVYGNCSCVAVGLNISSHDPNATATSGRCDDGCKNIYIMVPCMFLMSFLTVTTLTPSSMATLRSVDQNMRSFALGVQWVFLQVVGSIPGPIVAGSVIDTACLVWNSSSKDDSRSCLLYHKHNLALRVMILWTTANVIGASCYFISSLISFRKKTKNRATDVV